MRRETRMSATDSRFTPDVGLAKKAARAADDAIRFCRLIFRRDLSYRPADVRAVEEIADLLHREHQRQLRGEAAHNLAFMLGSLLGEIFIRQHGGEWGVADVEGARVPGIRFGNRRCWPHERAWKRLVVGAEEDLWVYYEELRRLAIEGPNRV
jgi:hypothetical protein